MIPSAQPARPADSERGDQEKATSDTINKKSDEADDVDNKGTANKRGSKKADRGDGTEAKEAGHNQGDNPNHAAEQGDNPKHAAEAGKGDEKAAARDGKDDKNDSRGSRVSLNSNERTKIQTYFRDHRPSGHRVERSAVSVSLGFAVPSTIVLAPLPPDVIVVSAACPIEYFVWAEDLVLVDSCSRQVVDIIPGAA
jgi:hypothetical protein